MSTKPTNSNKIVNLVLEAIRRRFISRGVHPARAVHIPSEVRLVIRHTKTSCRTAIEHDGSTLFLVHDPGTGIDKIDLKKISLADPELIDKAVNWIADWD